MPYEILIYGDIVREDVSEYWPDSVSPKQVYDSLNEANGQDVLVRFNSPGGSADAGVAISNLLSDYDGETAGRVDGLAASAATIALMGCGQAEMASNAALMIHAASYFTYGQFNGHEFRDFAKQLDNYDQRIAQTYAKKSEGKTADDFLEMMATDTYLTADECKELGLIDVITDESEDDILVTQKVFSSLQLDQMPTGVAARIRVDTPKIRAGKMQEHVKKAQEKKAAPKISLRNQSLERRFRLT